MEENAQEKEEFKAGVEDTLARAEPLEQQKKEILGKHKSKKKKSKEEKEDDREVQGRR